MNENPNACRVLTAERAVEIAVSELSQRYGVGCVGRQRPFKAELSGDVWYVTGSLSPHSIGGVAEAAIRQADGTLLWARHGE